MRRTALWAAVMASILHGLASAAAPDAAALTTLSVENARTLAGDPSGRVSLPRLTSLSVEAATELAKHDGWLELPGLTTLGDDVAAALSKHVGPLFLDGLQSLSAPAAAALAQHRGYMSLNGITSLSDEAVKPLFVHGGQDVSGESLSVNGLQTLSVDAAKALAGRRSPVSLRGLSSLTPAAAAALAAARAWDGVLPGFTTVSKDLAVALAQRQHGITLPALTSLPADVAEAFQGRLRTGAELTSLSVDALKVLAPTDGMPTVFNRLTTLSEDEAKIVAMATRNVGRASLVFNALPRISPEVARVLMKREGYVYFNAVTTIPDDVVKALVEEQNYHFEPRVYFDGLTELSDESVAILTKWRKWSGRFPALKSVSAPAAAALGNATAWDGSLPALKTLSAEAARGLAATRGDLRLDGLTDMSVETAEALAAHRGGLLSLDGLPTIAAPAAAALAKRTGRLSLDGLEALPDPVATALAGHAGDWLFLDGVETLSDTAAKSLAAHRGAVSVLGLKALSPVAAGTLRGTGRIIVAEAIPRPAPAAVTPVDEKFVAAFLADTCAGCHDAASPEGEFVVERLSKDSVAGRVAYASILERLQAGDMPPPDEPRPDAKAVASVSAWIRGLLDAPLPGPVAAYAVREKPVDGNRLPHAILFGGPRGPSVPPPPRLWRLSPGAYDQWVGAMQGGGGQQPFGLHLDRGFKDFAALYSPDEGTASLLLTNAEQIVNGQVHRHQLVNVVEKPELAKERLWPDEGRLQAASPEEQKALAGGLRVRGNGVFAPLMHPQVRATRQELENAIGQQFFQAVARRPSADEMQRLSALYDDVCRDGDMRIAGQAVLMAPLMVPEAVLRFEVGLGPEVRPGVRMLAPREVALAVSYALSQSRLKGLFDAADAGGLASRDEVTRQVKALLDDPQTPKSRVFGFFREFLSYHLAAEVFKDPLPDPVTRRGVHYSPGAFMDATDATVLRILARDRDVLRELLTTSVASEGGGEAIRNNVMLDRGRSLVFRPLPPRHGEQPNGGRIGIPMHSSWLVSWSTNFHNDPVRRGRWVREQLLGGRVPDLPINAAAMIPDDPHRTLRERQSVTRKAECWKCHYRMDDLGLPFEFTDHYGMDQPGERIVDKETMDKTGHKGPPLFRTVAFDTTGMIAHSGDPTIDGPVRDAPEMLRRLAGSDRVRQVFIRHVFRYFLGRNEAPGDAETLQAADRVYLESGGSFKAVLGSLLTSESFLYRTPPVPSSASGSPPTPGKKAG